jgi:hypothetical protein
MPWRSMEPIQNAEKKTQPVNRAIMACAVRNSALTAHHIQANLQCWIAKPSAAGGRARLQTEPRSCRE